LAGAQREAYPGKRQHDAGDDSGRLFPAEAVWPQIELIRERRDNDERNAEHREEPSDKPSIHDRLQVETGRL
jgi:hypothetical protein